jgi:hypothetical protein
MIALIVVAAVLTAIGLIAGLVWWFVSRPPTAPLTSVDRQDSIQGRQRALGAPPPHYPGGRGHWEAPYRPLHVGRRAPLVTRLREPPRLQAAQPVQPALAGRPMAIRDRALAPTSIPAKASADAPADAPAEPRARATDASGPRHLRRPSTAGCPGRPRARPRVLHSCPRHPRILPSPTAGPGCPTRARADRVRRAPGAARTPAIDSMNRVTWACVVCGEADVAWRLFGAGPLVSVLECSAPCPATDPAPAPVDCACCFSCPASPVDSPGHMPGREQLARHVRGTSHPLRPSVPVDWIGCDRDSLTGGGARLELRCGRRQS